MGLHIEHEHNPFIKRVSRVNPNMTRTRLASTHDLFINGLVVPVYKWVSHVRFACRVRFCHPYLKGKVCNISIKNYFTTLDKSNGSFGNNLFSFLLKFFCWKCAKVYLYLEIFWKKWEKVGKSEVLKNCT